MSVTSRQYDGVVQNCRELFISKTKDYGTSWTILRPVSIVDQIFIKAQRIRTIQEKKEQRIGDNIRSEFIGIVNYGVIGMIQIDYEPAGKELQPSLVHSWYDEKVNTCKKIMENKNHDYGEAWRSMSQESFADLILMKLMRIRQILTNDGKTLVSEGIDANFIDIINYSLFALILIEEGKHVG
ncbi:MAG TPA: DUF1599 domain-containing protein [Flavitalea sp.]|nr:DUF1599 domain-containing protein [Flavitalea sp.]